MGDSGITIARFRAASGTSTLSISNVFSDIGWKPMPVRLRCLALDETIRHFRPHD